MLKLARERALRVFEGSQDAYPAWQKLFRQLIHTQRASSRPRPLNICLERCLSKPIANDVIEGTEADLEGYRLALKRLEGAYGGADRRYHAAYKRLEEAKAVKEDDVVGLKRLLRAVENYVASLKGMGRRE